MRPSELAIAALVASALASCAPIYWGRDALADRKVLVVEALDRSDQGAGMPIARALAGALVREGATVVGVCRRPGSVLSPAWLRSRAGPTHAQTVVTATVSAWNLQTGRRRAFVAMTGLALGLDGTILWAQRETATVPFEGEKSAKSVMVAAENPSPDPQDESRALAARLCAKEFADVLARHLAP